MVENVSRRLRKQDSSSADKKEATEYIERLEQDRLERELAEACTIYCEFNKQFSSDWSRYETRVE